MRRLVTSALGILPVLATGMIVAATPAAALHVMTVTGRIQVLDSVGGSAGHRAYLGLSSGEHSWRLRVPNDWALRTGTVVRVSGSATQHLFTASRVRIVSTPPPAATGATRKVAVIHVSWSGNPSDGMTAPTLSTAMAGAGTWFNEVSYGALTGLTTTVDSINRVISGPDDCSVPTGSDQIMNRAITAAGITESQFDDVIVYFPLAASGCTFAGLGTIGGGRVWLNGDITNRVINHELGHNLGLYHSHAPICHGGGVTQVTLAVPTSCDDLDSGNEYGDVADVMGGDAYAGHYSASQKAQLGWFGSGLQTSNPCAGALTLKPYEAAPVAGDVQAVRIAAGADAATNEPVTYWLEYRQPAAGTVDNGFNSNAPLPAGLTDGVLIHMTDPGPSVTSAFDIGPLALDGKPSADYNNADFIDAALSSGTVTTPQGISFTVNSHTATSAGVTVSTTLPGIPRQTSALVNGSGVDVSWQPPACDGGSAVTGYHLTRVGGATVDTPSTSATSAGLPGQGGAEYLVSATSGAGTGAAAVVPATAPTITAVDLNVSGGVGFDFDTSVSNGGRPIIYYVVHATPVHGAPPVDDNYYYDIGTHSDRHSYLVAGAGKTYDVTILPLYSDFTFGPASAPVRVTVEDQSAPNVSLKAPTASVILSNHTLVKWSGTDSGGAGVKSYDVRYRSAPSNGGFGGYVMPANWQKTTSTNKSLTITRGSTYCFSVRARDGNLNTSGWSAQKCTTSPLDERSLGADSHWSTNSGAAFYAGTLSSASHKGSTLTRTNVTGKHLSLVVTTCHGCGKVAVYADGTKIDVLDLSSSATHDRVVEAVTVPHALHAATVKLKVVTAGKPVKIDGLAVRAV